MPLYAAKLVFTSYFKTLTDQQQQNWNIRLFKTKLMLMHSV